MAHILVYLERTPRGLHPASALALCVARDIASNRGASVTAVCPGDAGDLDAGITRAAARFGADVMVFASPTGLVETVERLRPVHLLAPWTPHGLAAVGETDLGPAVPRWVERARPPGAGADTVTGIVAGALPWHTFDTTLDPEYLGPVDTVKLPGWVAPIVAAVDQDSAPGFSMVPKGGLHYVAPRNADAAVHKTLEQLGAQLVTEDDIDALAEGALLFFADGTQPLPDALQQCPATTRSVVFAGPDATVDPSWMYADLVVPGAWAQAVARLHEPLWSAALA